MPPAPSPDVLVARIASRQDGVVTTRQLVAAGVSRDGILRRARAGRLHAVHQGVWAVGHRALPPDALDRAALLANGEQSALSLRSAAPRWQLLPRPDDGLIEVTVPAHRRQREGIRVHRAPLPAHEVRIRDGLRVTSPLRTIRDLARDPSFGSDELAAAVGEALFRRLVTDEQLQAIPRVRRLLHTGEAGSRHEAERAVLKLLRRAGLPRPQTNARVLGREADFYWPEHHFVLELDGFDGHGPRPAFKRDRRRDVQRRAHGIETLHTTWDQIVHEHEVLLVAVTRAVS